MIRNRYFGWVAAVALLAACDSPLDTSPTDSIDAETALSTARGVELALTGAYRSTQSGSLFGNVEMTYPDLYADNLDYTGTFDTDREVALRQLNSDNTQILDTWEEAYDGINRVNGLLEAIPNVSELSSSQQTTYRGEALFIRALLYSVLARYHGDVPLVLTASRGVSSESLVTRTPVAEVREQIIADLAEAATLLPATLVQGRATQYAANALAARVNLDAGNYTEARDLATSVIDGPFDLVDDYQTIWTTKNSDEAIFELQFRVGNTNSLAYWYFPQTLGGRLGYAPTAEYYSAFSPGDERRDATIKVTEDGQRYAAKYFRVAAEDDNVVVLRLAEMYLIRAEANAQLGAPAATVRADINMVRNRAGVADLPDTVVSEEDLLMAILDERRLEFGYEGQRFFDLRRLGMAQSVLGLNAERLLWPIPQAEREVNPSLTQNPGY